MGLFSKSRGSLSEIESMLERSYVQMFQMTMGMSLSEARDTFRDMLAQAKEESVKEGTSNLPKNFGDILLEKEAHDAGTTNMLAKKRREGVKDEDIRWWWNMHDLERRIMLKVDDLHKIALYMKLVKGNGLSADAAAIELRKFHPIFGDPEQTTQTSGDDRPLPYELKDRINRYIEKRMQIDPEGYEKYIRQSSSFNAFVRKSISNGTL